VNEQQRRTIKMDEKGKGFLVKNHQEKPTDYLFPSVGESVLLSSD
jgi:hypothetical protein